MAAEERISTKMKAKPVHKRKVMDVSLTPVALRATIPKPLSPSLILSRLPQGRALMMMKKNMMTRKKTRMIMRRARRKREKRQLWMMI